MAQTPVWESAIFRVFTNDNTDFVKLLKEKMEFCGYDEVDIRCLECQIEIPIRDILQDLRYRNTVILNQEDRRAALLANPGKSVWWVYVSDIGQYEYVCEECTQCEADRYIEEAERKAAEEANLENTPTDEDSPNESPNNDGQESSVSYHPPDTPPTTDDDAKESSNVLNGNNDDNNISSNTLNGNNDDNNISSNILMEIDDENKSSKNSMEIDDQNESSN